MATRPSAEVEYLVDMGADLATVDRNKDTAYDLAIQEHADRLRTKCLMLILYTPPVFL